MPLERFIDDFPEDERSLPYQLFFDFLFTSFDLLQNLSHMGFVGTSTIQESRVGKRYPLPFVKVSKKMERGSIEFISNQEDNVQLVK